MPGSTAYTTAATHYWSNVPAEATPACIFKPASADQLSVFLLITRLTQSEFAVKSGGHAAFAGASSTSTGITVSMENFNQVTLSQDRKTAAVGPGNTWESVYDALDPYNLTVIGGRASDVGVGGLMLGGGISFFSSLYGWACDNVVSYQMVTACGTTVTASATQNQDLFYALRGGGNNFGIVTKFNLAVFSLPGGAIWGGTRIYQEQHMPATINAFTQMANNIEKDPSAGSWLTFVNYGGFKVSAAELWHVGQNGSNATIFSNYSAIPSISDDTQNRNLSGYTEKVEAPDPYGFRQYFYTMTVKNDANLTTAAKDIFFEESDLSSVPGSLIVMTMQSITVPQLQQMSKNGGNPLGLSAADGPLTLVLIACRWNNAADDATAYAAGSNTLTRIKDQSMAMGLDVNYVYMNYGAQYQDIVASYGDANKQKLINIAQRYDPTGVFQTLSPGFFKLDRAPVPGTEYFSH
ncbi:hypothetical protein ANO11243_010380 [Dothideomycetidae sp. 11243]|nr:hypothetical protein ANO11243_010380 [fungal sp. No.11243]